MPRSSYVPFVGLSPVDTFILELNFEFCRYSFFNYPTLMRRTSSPTRLIPLAHAFVRMHSSRRLQLAHTSQRYVVLSFGDSVYSFCPIS